ncbi:MAG TPA: hypothetical protein VFE25_00735 [Opitutaceae bacterium]|nr:hypothetical protein [Opitutaceae bacterium]
MRSSPRLLRSALVAAFLSAFDCAGATLQAPLILKGGADGAPLGVTHARPLDELVVDAPAGTSVEVRDAAGKVYVNTKGGGRVSFLAAGALGRQEVAFRDEGGREVGNSGFNLEAETSVDDGGKYKDMFTLFHNGMSADVPGGVDATKWNGRTYHFFVTWVLDNYHTAKGMKYFSPYGTDFVDMMRAAQREDGMIWSNINPGQAVAYYKTAYGPFDYIRRIGDRYFVRQPAENHPEYVYVSTIYQTWKTHGDDAWMAGCLDSARRAMDYCMKDPARWSDRFRLLKRVYTIDSWDFQVDDAYTPDIGLSKTMLVDAKKSKFGVFFGDNVYYAESCDELAEMLAHTGDAAGAASFTARGTEIRSRLDALSWNGRFYTHFIDEDPTVKRDLGVDEKTQVAQGNAYSLNRGISGEHAVAIIRTYMDLKDHLPVGSPGEWYAIYPPFGKGFGLHDQKWQYMNGGVGGHVAGELARGAFENGYEPYARDILDRLTDLGHRHGNKIWFAYTGSVPPAPPAPVYKAIDLSGFANMDIEDKGGPGSSPWMLMGRAGDDIRGLPTGDQVFAGITFKVADPATNRRKVAVAVSHRPGLPASVDVPVVATAGCVYLLHTSTKPTSENICGSVAFVYSDGSRRVQYISMGKQLTYWWFSELKTDHSGIAWHGPSPVADDVGVSWCAVDNPSPEKTIASIRLNAPEDDGIYTVLGMTLSDRPHYVAPDPVSYGGPDDWAASTAMAAMMEGLVGVKDAPLSQTLSHPVLAPRWDLSAPRSIRATVRYPASGGYVAYRFVNNPVKRTITVTVAGSAASMDGHILLPPGTDTVRSVTVDGSTASYGLSRVGESRYVDLAVPVSGAREVGIGY